MLFLEFGWFSTAERSGREAEWHSYSVQAGLLTGEGEGESQRKTRVLHAHVVEEVADTLHYVIKQLEEGKHNVWNQALCKVFSEN